MVSGNNWQNNSRNQNSRPRDAHDENSEGNNNPRLERAECLNPNAEINPMTAIAFAIED